MTEKEKKQVIVLSVLIGVLVVSILVMQMRLKAQRERFNQGSSVTTPVSGSSVYVPSGSSSLASSGTSTTISGSANSNLAQKTTTPSTSTQNNSVSTPSNNDDSSGDATTSGSDMTTQSVQAFYKNRQDLTLTLNAELFKKITKISKTSQEMEEVQAQANTNMIATALNQAINQIKYSGYYQSGNNMVFMIMYNNQNYTYTNSGQLSVTANGQNYTLNLSLTPDNDLMITNSTYNIAQTISM